MMPLVDYSALSSLDLIRHEGNGVPFSERREAERKYEDFRNAAYTVAKSEFSDPSRSDAVGYVLTAVYDMTNDKRDILPNKRIETAIGEIEKRADMHPRANWQAIKGALDGVIESVGMEKFAHMLFTAETVAGYPNSVLRGAVCPNYLM